MIEDNEEVDTVSIMWECNWDLLKKTPEVQYFMETVYVEWPKHRLVPREACE